MDALLTFFLPVLSAGQTPQSASLSLGTCVDSGAGFAGLGTMTLYQDPFGRFTDTSTDLTQQAAGAETITTLTTCAPLDVTAAVTQAYASGIPVIQFRLAFPDILANNQGDKVSFSDPRLTISLH
jgi:hypothetical protein